MIMDAIFTAPFGCAPSPSAAVCADEVAFQALVFKNVSQLLRYPDETLAACVEELAGMFSPESPEWQLLDGMACALQECTLLDLERDYTALFIGALHIKAVPFASYYLDGKHQLNGPSTLRISRCYSQMGLTHSPQRQQPEDHMATMAEYLCAVLGKALVSESVQAQMLISKAQDFFSEYLQPCIPQFTHSVAKGAETRFYSLLGQLLPILMIEDSLMDSFVHLRRN